MHWQKERRERGKEQKDSLVWGKDGGSCPALPSDMRSTGLYPHPHSAASE